MRETKQSNTKSAAVTPCPFGRGFHRGGGAWNQHKMEIDIIPIVIWIALSVGVGLIAGARGHSAGAYFAISLIVSPLIGIIAACAIPSPKN